MPSRALVYDGWRTVDRIGKPACTVQIVGATHMSFMDVPFLSLSDDSPARAMLHQPRSTRHACGASPATCSWRSSPSTATVTPEPSVR